MAHVVLAGLLLVHGLAHLVGFAVPWKLVQSEEMPWSTTLLAGRLDVGEFGIRFVGLLWLGLAAAFAVAAAGAWLGRPGWPDVAMVVSVASLVLCVAGWPASRIGVWVNVGFLVILGAGRVTQVW